MTAVPDEITVDEWRRLVGAGATSRRPRTPPAPRVKGPRAQPAAAADAGETAREPYVARGWTFAQEGRELARWAYHRETGARVGPAATLAELLGMIDERERGQ